MKRSIALIFIAFANVALAQGTSKPAPAPYERWFSLSKTTTGYLAAGNLAGTFWAFHVQGDDVKRLSETTFGVGGVVLQVRPVMRSVLGEARGGLLAAQKRFEQRHQAEATPGVTFGDHDFCHDAKFPYQQWTARPPTGGIVQAYVTFEVGDYVLMVVAPYENEARRKAVARALGEVCESFRKEKAP